MTYTKWGQGEKIMKYKKIKYGSNDITLIQTDKFKTITIRVTLRTKMKKEDITKQILLGNLLLEGTKKYPSKRLLSLRTEELYNVGVQMSCKRTGIFNNINITMTLLDEKYTEPGMFEKSIELLSEILFQPNIQDNRFDEKIVTIGKDNLKTTIASIKESPGAYANMRMLEEMAPNTPLSYRSVGYLEDLEAITAENMATYYHELMKEASFDIYVLGNIDFAQTEKLIKQYFQLTTFKKEHLKAELMLPFTTAKVKEYQELSPMTQSKLVIGCRTKEMDPFEKNYVWNLYSIILGGSPDSKFFLNIREKYSLAYYVTSSIRRLDSIMVLQAGIDAKNFKKTVALIEHEMDDMKKGNFTEEDIDKAKKTYQNAIQEIMDSPQAIIESYVSMNLSDIEPLEERKEKITEVTKEDIVKLATKIKIDTIYLLKGKEVPDEEN